ncbi:MAG: transcriptional regulator [Vicinamibacterales bacterium]|jgi:DNA-binding MarR family transcriptional regulator|nr:transcriptional regulator [Acidobacteriota bacterium]MDP6373313.1 transcriptional regulator [Vicinamibacterales bacterium]MDP6610043.1 transcriptional regulator [Vicinamibacterales bacterium]HAK56088.1 transcriptional regulator [Acidobacteriota bacterium]|tara:strand:- start:1496 stop:1903 length:408 start_codon:yes stop_codon:yes gene_type:complete
MPRHGQTENAKPAVAGTGRFSYEGLDRVMHEKARLGILASLAANLGGLLFNDLKQLCSLTDGNLSRHLTVLSEARLVETWKGTTGPRPQTMYRLTARGRHRFADYIGVLEKVVADAQAEVQPDAGPQLSKGWSPA